MARGDGRNESTSDARTNHDVVKAAREARDLPADPVLPPGRKRAGGKARLAARLQRLDR